MLLALLGGPVAWTVHLFVGYAVLALWCSRGWPGPDGVLGVLTVFAFAASAASVVLAYRLWRIGRQELLSNDPQPAEAPESSLTERSERLVFLAVIALFLSALFAFLILWQGLAPVVAPECNPAPGP